MLKFSSRWLEDKADRLLAFIREYDDLHLCQSISLLEISQSNSIDVWKSLVSTFSRSI